MNGLLVWIGIGLLALSSLTAATLLILSTQSGSDQIDQADQFESSPLSASEKLDRALRQVELVYADSGDSARALLEAAYEDIVEVRASLDGSGTSQSAPQAELVSSGTAIMTLAAAAIGLAAALLGLRRTSTARRQVVLSRTSGGEPPT
jgi:hypothetical protein